MNYDNLTPDQAAVLTSHCEVDYECGNYIAFLWYNGQMLIEERETVLSAVIAVHQKRDELSIDKADKSL